MPTSTARKTLLLIAALAASVALVACGGGDDTTGSSSDTASTPEGTTEAFLTALANGDGAAACALASEEALSTIEGQAGTCEEAVTSSTGDVSDKDKQDVADATFEVTDETDTTATVTATKPDGQAQSFDLVLEGGEWKLNQ